MQMFANYSFEYIYFHYNCINLFPYGEVNNMLSSAILFKYQMPDYFEQIKSTRFMVLE